jgi:hypothetical protein
MQNDMRDRLVEILGDKSCPKQIPCDICEYQDFYNCHHYAVADHLIANGVVPVVRCKNCIYANDYGTICRYGVGRQVEPEHYCSYGERK